MIRPLKMMILKMTLTLHPWSMSLSQKGTPRSTKRATLFPERNMLPQMRLLKSGILAQYLLGIYQSWLPRRRYKPNFRFSDPNAYRISPRCSTVGVETTQTTPPFVRSCSKNRIDPIPLDRLPEPDFQTSHFRR